MPFFPLFSGWADRRLRRGIGPRQSANLPATLDISGLMSSSEIEFKAVPSIGDIPAEAWDACANPKANGGGVDSSSCIIRERYNPFIAHAFYDALESSRSACPRTGWAAQHLIAKRGNEIVGVVPCYMKSHSRGEYVFDGGWADAYERAGGNYYPKLQVSVPFTPVTGPRLLPALGLDAAEIKPALAASLAAVTDKLGVSSAHVTFARPDDISVLKEAGFLLR